jgi:hypothetical protein
MDAYNPGSRWNYPPQSIQYALLTDMQPNSQTQQGPSSTSHFAPGLTQQYARIWDDVPAAQHAPSTSTGWYLSNLVPAIQISPYYVPYLCLNPLLPCNYCGTARGEHPFDQCPHAIACIYCAQDHPRPTCPTPHQSCNPLICLIPENHRNAEPGGRTYSHWQCPWLGTIKYRY